MKKLILLLTLLLSVSANAAQKDIYYPNVGDRTSIDRSLQNAEDNFNELYPFDNVEAMGAATLTEGTIYSTNGYHTTGDGGRGDYLIVAGDSSDGYINHLANGGTHTAVLQTKAIDLRQAGAIPDWSDSLLTGTDNETAIEAACAWAMDNKKEVIVAGGKFSSGSILVTVTGDLTFSFDPGSWIVASVGLANPLLKLDAIGEPYLHTVLLNNPSIDVSHGDSTLISTSSCTAISSQYLKSGIARNVNLYAGESRSELKGDSGWGDVSSSYLLLDGGIIKGFSDAGVYWGGDNTVGVGVEDGITGMIRNVLFQECVIGVTAKREMTDLSVIGNRFDKCDGGVLAASVESGTTILAVRNLDIIDNHFTDVLSNNIKFLATTKGNIHGNTFSDWGYVENGTAATSAVYAVILRGAEGANVQGNIFQVKDKPYTGYQSSMLFENITLNSTLYTTGKHFISNNIHKGVKTAYVMTTGTNPSYYIDEHFDSVVLSPPYSADFNTSGLLTFTESGSTTLNVITGGIKTEEEQLIFKSLTIDLDIASLGTIAAGEQSAAQVIPVVGATSGSELSLIRQSATLANTPNILIVGRVATGEIQYVVRNNTASPFDCSAQVLKAVVRKSQ